MTLAEKLREKGVGKPDFTKEYIMDHIERKMTKCGYAQFLIGRHVCTDIKNDNIGDCNPYNRKFLKKWMDEEGLCCDSRFNSRGVEYIKITLK